MGPKAEKVSVVCRVCVYARSEVEGTGLVDIKVEEREACDSLCSTGMGPEGILATVGGERTATGTETALVEVVVVTVEVDRGDCELEDDARG